MRLKVSDRLWYNKTFSKSGGRLIKKRSDKSRCNVVYRMLTHLEHYVPLQDCGLRRTEATENCLVVQRHSQKHWPSSYLALLNYFSSCPCSFGIEMAAWYSLYRSWDHLQWDSFLSRLWINLLGHVLCIIWKQWWWGVKSVYWMKVTMMMVSWGEVRHDGDGGMGHSTCKDRLRVEVWRCRGTRTEKGHDENDCKD